MQRSTCNFFKQLVPLLSGFAVFIFTSSASSAETKLQDGLLVTYKNAENTTDVATAPNVWLYVPADSSPTPFLPNGKFTATWEGFLSVDLRGDYAFAAELNGKLKLEINGTNVLDASASNASTALSKPIRLSKGTNSFRATFQSPENGDAFVRLNWKPKKSFLQPIPSSALSHEPSDAEKSRRKLRLGRELFVEFRCAKCHAGPKTGMPELAMDAPSFEEIGARRNFEWMARWIENPKALRASAHMPRVFDGADAKEKSRAIAEFLSSLGKRTESAPTTEPGEKEIQAGGNLFATLYCAACHNAPGVAKEDPKKVSLKSVREKFAPGALVDFLKQPDLHYAWIAMPTFKLSEQQRAQLAAYLLANAEKTETIAPKQDGATITRGKELVQTSGCLNCHSLKLENRFSTKSLAGMTNWKSGCVAEEKQNDSPAPQFAFSAEQREALRAFGATDRLSLTRHVPAEFAERQSRILNCAECHNKIEGVPKFEILGGKLKPEWSAKFIAGKVDYKPRPWLAAQMPSFPKRAQWLAEGLAMQHGFPARTPPEPPIDMPSAEIGRNLVSGPPYGFSCTTCHAVGKLGAQVIETPGIDLALTGERLLSEFFHRWVMNPQFIDPVSKMPTYFDDDGGSPLTDVLGGDGRKQIDAIWQYIRLGEKIPAPKTE